MTFRPSFQNQQSLSQEESDLSFEETVKKVFDLIRPWFRSLPAETRTQYYSPAEVAKIMRVNPQTIMKWCRGGLGKKSGSRWLVTEEQIEVFLKRPLAKKGP